jgi:hypothetical protein
MADRVSASIVIGGPLSPTQFEMLMHLIESHDLSTDWDGPKFTPDARVNGEPLHLYALETPWGMFDDLEQYCCDQRIPYVRWSGACAGSFGAERIVFDGKTGPLNYSVDDDDHIVLHEQTIDQLGSMRAIRAYLKPAAFEVPRLAIVEV